jgi:Uma2 family endonuclease
MTTAGTTKLLTAEEFARLPDPPDGAKQELVRGEVITMPPPGIPHGRCQVKVAVKLEMYAQSVRPGTVTVESGMLTETGPDSVRGPDVAYWSNERMPPDQLPVVYANVAPELVVEVRSPGNPGREMARKISEYFASGVSVVWVVDPDIEAVTVYSQPDEGRAFFKDATIECEDVLPGFTCKVAEFFV